MSELPFITPETNTASFLVVKGYKLIGIQYQPRQNGKKRGWFIFEPSDNIREAADLFEKGEAAFNFADFETEKSRLIDRIKAGLP